MTGLFDKILGREKPSDKNDVYSDTLHDEFVVPTDSQVEYQKNHQLIVGIGLSVGMQRDQNQDALFTLTNNVISDHNQMLFGIFLVADGMGGHLQGELASGIAVRVIGSHLTQKLQMVLLGSNPTFSTTAIHEMLHSSVMEANRAILNEAPGSGTTLTAALVLGDQLTIAHVGDSRAYSVLSNGDLNPLTRDHSLVMRMIELGQISSAQAAVHPQRNVLYKALGQEDDFDLEISSSTLIPSSYLLLCSDGLWGVVPENELSEIIISSTNPQSACQQMIKSANESGGPDNITAILVQIPETFGDTSSEDDLTETQEIPIETPDDEHAKEELDTNLISINKTINNIDKYIVTDDPE